MKGIIRSKKQLLGIFLCMVMLLSCISLTAAAAETGYTYDAETNIYSVSTAEGLRAIAALVNGGTNNINVVLTADIDLGGTEWTPIGNGPYPYAGHFDGQGHTVSGLSISQSYNYESSNIHDSCPGLFGMVKGAGIRNLKVSGTVNCDMGMGNYVDGKGMLVGAMIDSILYNCYVSGTVGGAGTSTGGMVGTARHSIIINCGANVTVSGTDSYLGGLVGYMSAGYDTPLCLLNSYCVGSVTHTNTSTAASGIGGLAGCLGDDAVNNYFSGTVTDQGPANSDGTRYMGVLFGKVSNQIAVDPSNSTELTAFTPVIEKNYYASGTAIGSVPSDVDASGYTATYSSNEDLQSKLNSNLETVDNIIAGHRGYLTTTQWAELVTLLDGENVKAFHWHEDGATPYILDQCLTDTVDYICDVCGGPASNAEASLIRNGTLEGAYASVTDAIVAASSATADDKVVVMLLKDMDFGDDEIAISDGVFTLDLNGCKISSTNTLCFLQLTNSANLTVMDSGTGGTIQAVGAPIRIRDTASVTMNSGSLYSTEEEAFWIQRTGSLTFNGGTISSDGYSVITCSNSGSVTINGGTANAKAHGLDLGVDTTATITGGTFNCTQTDIICKGTVVLKGGTFTGGIKVTDKTLNEILDRGYGYWTGKTMLYVVDDAQSIADQGDVMVKVACAHGNSQQKYISNGENHTHIYLCCNLRIIEPHKFTEDTCTLCGFVCDHSTNTNDFADTGTGYHTGNCSVCQLYLEGIHTYENGICTTCDTLGYAYDEETNTYRVYDPAALQPVCDASAITSTEEKPDTIQLMKDLDMSAVRSLGVVVGASATLDLNGYDLFSVTHTISVTSGTLTVIGDGSITCSDLYNGCAIVVTGKLDMQGGTTGDCPVWLESGELQMSNGSIGLLRMRGNSTATITGGVVNKVSINGGILRISGGYLHEEPDTSPDHCVITGGTFGFEPSGYVDQTIYKISDNNDGTYTVSCHHGASAHTTATYLDGDTHRIICTICNAEAVQEHRWGTDGEGHTCTDCGAKKDSSTLPRPAVSVSLTEKVVLNFYVPEDLVNEENRIVVKCDGEILDASKYVVAPEAATLEYRISIPLNANNMCDELSLQILNANGAPVSQERTESIRSYVRLRLNNANAPVKEKRVFMAALEYGTLAQLALDPNSTDLANSVITDSDRAFFDGFTWPTATNDPDAAVGNTNDSKFAVTASLKDAVVLNFYIYKTDLGSNKIQIKRNGAVLTEGEDYTITEVGKEYCVSIPMNANHMCDVFSAQVVDAEGEAVYAERSLSMRHYVSMRLVNPSATAAEKRVFIAALDYGALAQLAMNESATDLANRYITEADRNIP